MQEDCDWEQEKADFDRTRRFFCHRRRLLYRLSVEIKVIQSVKRIRKPHYSNPMESSSKRARAPGNITQVAHCLVDGCNADLSICRDYHRRHKVCEAHSKTPTVTIGGREQRFCQQCSRLFLKIISLFKHLNYAIKYGLVKCFMAFLSSR